MPSITSKSILALSTSVLCMTCFNANASSPSEILSKLEEDFDTYLDMVDKTNYVRLTFVNIQNQVNPGPITDEWKAILPEIKSKAEKYSKLKIEFDKFDTPQVQKELNACPTYKAALVKVDNRIIYLREMQSKLPSIISSLEKSKSKVQESLEAADKISQIYSSLAADALRYAFAKDYLDWAKYDIEIALKPALGNLHGAIIESIKKQKVANDKMGKNIADFEKFTAQTKSWIPKVEDYCRRNNQ